MLLDWVFGFIFLLPDSNPGRLILKNDHYQCAVLSPPPFGGLLVCVEDQIGKLFSAENSLLNFRFGKNTKGVLSFCFWVWFKVWSTPLFQRHVAQSQEPCSAVFVTAHKLLSAAFIRTTTMDYFSLFRLLVIISSKFYPSPSKIKLDSVRIWFKTFWFRRCFYYKEVLYLSILGL